MCETANSEAQMRGGSETVTGDPWDENITPCIIVYTSRFLETTNCTLSLFCVLLRY